MPRLILETLLVFTIYIWQRIPPHPPASKQDWLNQASIRSKMVLILEDFSEFAKIANQLIVHANHKLREYFVYRDGHGLGSMPIHLAHHCLSFDLRV